MSERNVRQTYTSTYCMNSLYNSISNKIFWALKNSLFYTCILYRLVYLLRTMGISKQSKDLPCYGLLKGPTLCKLHFVNVLSQWPLMVSYVICSSSRKSLKQEKSIFYFFCVLDFYVVIVSLQKALIHSFIHSCMHAFIHSSSAVSDNVEWILNSNLSLKK